MSLGDVMSPKLQEALFQEAICNWERTRDVIYWEQMWMRVLECCKALALKIAPGKPLVEERSVDAAIKVMDRIERLNKHPNKLSSYCYWPVKEALQGPQAMHEDLEECLYEEYEEQTQDKACYVLGICRKELMNTDD